jgi:hypothetical protein
MQTEGLVGEPNPGGMGPNPTTGIGPSPTGMGLRDEGPQSRVGVAELLEQVLEQGASDLHLTAGAKPTVRVNGRLIQLEDYPVLQPRPLPPGAPGDQGREGEQGPLLGRHRHPQGQPGRRPASPPGQADGPDQGEQGQRVLPVPVQHQGRHQGQQVGAGDQGQAERDRGRPGTVGRPGTTGRTVRAGSSHGASSTPAGPGLSRQTT